MSTGSRTASRAPEIAYGRSARVYDALCRHKDYARASATLRDIVRRVTPAACSLLDVACGTGRHLEHLRRDFRVEGLDLSPDMLAVARARCPDVRFHEGSLVDFRLAGRYDAVTCLFGSMGHARTLDGLHGAVASMARHLQPGGVLIVEPWITPAAFVTGRLVCDTVNDPDLKVARMYVTDRDGDVSIFDEHYLIATADEVEHFTERHELGLFTDEQYRDAFIQTGLQLVDASLDLFGYGLYVSTLKRKAI
jgi:dTDP-3-amino-3,4,6-trideoxy-alpha-D-glucopyranose N,N-dimethyltransferase